MVKSIHDSHGTISNSFGPLREIYYCVIIGDEGLRDAIGLQDDEKDTLKNRKDCSRNTTLIAFSLKQQYYVNHI